MRKFFKDFKTFINKGNIVDLAVAVVVGGAFGKIVSSFVANIINPLIGLLLGKVHLDDLKIVLTKADEAAGVTELALSYGVFLQSFMDFIVIALSIFVALRVLNRLSAGAKKHVKETKKQLKARLAQLQHNNIDISGEALPTASDSGETLPTVSDSGEALVQAEKVEQIAAPDSVPAQLIAPDSSIELLKEIRDLLKAQQ